MAIKDVIGEKKDFKFYSKFDTEHVQWSQIGEKYDP